MWRRWVVTVCGIALMAGAVIGFEWRVRHGLREQPRVRIVQPVQMLPVGTIVQHDMLRYVDVVAAPAQAMKRIDDVVGKHVAVPIASDEPIALWKLSDVHVPSVDERVVTFSDEAVVSSGVAVGDVVDVWIELDQPVRIGGVWTAAVPVIASLPIVAAHGADGAVVARGQNTKRVSLTFVMNATIYETFVLAKTLGTIRFLIPNVRSQEQASVAKAFSALRDQVSWERGGGRVDR
jgi:hypothetical protein